MKQTVSKRDVDSVISPYNTVLESAFLLFFCGDRSYHIWMKGWRVKLSDNAFEVIRQVALNKLYECVHTYAHIYFLVLRDRKIKL